MAHSIKTNRAYPVAILGAGPVGLTLAIDLAQRGVDVALIERRAADAKRPVKCNHISARSMEIFRRLGVAKRLRNAGLPANYPNDASFRTTVTGRELSRIPIPCRRDRYTATDGPDTWWPTPEPPHRLNQIYMEPILWQYAAEQPKITIFASTEIERFEQFDDRVLLYGSDLNSGDQFRLAAGYLVGCDGGRSLVRKGIGASFVGDAVIQRVQSTDIRAPGLLTAMRADPAWAIVNLNPRRSGTLYAIDGQERWLVHNYLRPEETNFEAIDRMWALRTILGVDEDFEIEILNKEDWVGRRLVADKFRDRRVFLCGDSAHIWVPYGGYGMNAGIADAATLAWQLAGVVNGWGGPGLLDAYEAERLPITEQVSRFAMDHAAHMIKNRRRVPEEIEADGPAAEATRQAFGQELYDLNVQQYCCAGLNFGSYAEHSPIIAYDEEVPPPYSMGSFTPSTVPGCRTPHVWLPDGRSLYDAMGNDYALLRFDPAIDLAPFMRAAQEHGLPIKPVDLDPAVVPDVYTSKLLISRPDQQIAWRGDQIANEEIGLSKHLMGINS